MLYISHRVNTIKQLRETPDHYGVEFDLREYQGRIILQHDPFIGGEDFSEYLLHFRHAFMILNVKCDGLESRVLELVGAAGIDRYFFLDCAFPTIRKMVNLGEHRIAVRFSEYEPIESALSLRNQVDWVWVDCFKKMPLTDESYERLKEHFKICIVSPELQGHSVELIPEFSVGLSRYSVDAICTKRPDLWASCMKRAA